MNANYLSKSSSVSRNLETVAKPQLHIQDNRNSFQLQSSVVNAIQRSPNGRHDNQQRRTGEMIVVGRLANLNNRNRAQIQEERQRIAAMVERRTDAATFNYQQQLAVNRFVSDNVAHRRGRMV